METFSLIIDLFAMATAAYWLWKVATEKNQTKVEEYRFWAIITVLVIIAGRMRI